MFSKPTIKLSESCFYEIKIMMEEWNLKLLQSLLKSDYPLPQNFEIRWSFDQKLETLFFGLSQDPLSHKPLIFFRDQEIGPSGLLNRINLGDFSAGKCLLHLSAATLALVSISPIAQRLLNRRQISTDLATRILSNLLLDIFPNIHKKEILEDLMGRSYPLLYYFYQALDDDQLNEDFLWLIIFKKLITRSEYQIEAEGGQSRNKNLCAVVPSKENFDLKKSSYFAEQPEEEILAKDLLKFLREKFYPERCTLLFTLFKTSLKTKELQEKDAFIQFQKIFYFHKNLNTWKEFRSSYKELKFDKKFLSFCFLNICDFSLQESFEALEEAGYKDLNRNSISKWRNDLKVILFQRSSILLLCDELKAKSQVKSEYLLDLMAKIKPLHLKLKETILNFLKPKKLCYELAQALLQKYMEKNPSKAARILKFSGFKAQDFEPFSEMLHIENSQNIHNLNQQLLSWGKSPYSSLEFIDFFESIDNLIEELQLKIKDGFSLIQLSQDKKDYFLLKVCEMNPAIIGIQADESKIFSIQNKLEKKFLNYLDKKIGTLIWGENLLPDEFIKSENQNFRDLLKSIFLGP